LVVIAACGLIVLLVGMRLALWAHQADAIRNRQEFVSTQLLELRQMATALVEVENGERGYLFTGNAGYLKRYDEARGDLNSRMARLDKTAQVDSGLGPDIAELVRLAREKDVEAAQAIQLRSAGDQQAALSLAADRDLLGTFRTRFATLSYHLRPQIAELDQEQAAKFRNIYTLAAIAVPVVVLLIVAACISLTFSIQHLREREQHEARAAMHDALTGLPNRRYLEEWLRMSLPAARRAGSRLVVLYFDLDGFKGVNDRFGHEAGDRVLQVTAHRLRRALRVSDFVARLGGDEFVAALRETPTPSAVAMMINRLQSEIAKAPIEELTDGAVTASIGAAWYPEDGDSVEALLAAADRAMYEVKQRRSAFRGRRIEEVPAVSADRASAD
jgi:diguanylate cyclase (GGDEF)-like protein